MARRDPEARERLARFGDVGVRIRVDPLPALDARLEQAEVLELPCARGIDPRPVAETLEVEALLLLAERGRPPPAPLLPRSGGELLPDDAQRQELVALQAQDRLQPLEVFLGEQPVATLCPLRGQEPLVLEIPDLRDGDVGELGLQPAADSADREEPLAGWGGCSHQRLRKVIRYLPI